MSNIRKMSIKIILGCMYSGKTTEVISLCNKWFSISKKVVCINYEFDNRYGNDEQLYSHDLVTVDCIKTLRLELVDNKIINDADIILINEGQFFPDLIEYCLLWCEKYGKNIIVSGLDGDYKRQPFGDILNLIPYADTVTKLYAFCTMCQNGTHAIFTHRNSEEKEQIVIGSNNYMALCRNCYCKLNDVVKN